jgi:hypothetical protein
MQRGPKANNQQKSGKDLSKEDPRQKGMRTHQRGPNNKLELKSFIDHMKYIQQGDRS